MKHNFRYVTPEESQYYIKLSPGKMHKADAFTRISNDDGWDDVYYLAHSIIDASGGVRPMFSIDSYTAQKVIEVLGQKYSSTLHADSLINFKTKKND
jgi:hypothetical protein